MARGAREFARARWEEFCGKPFGCLLRLFLGRMFQGSGESGAEGLDLSVAVFVILLGLPGLMVSLLMFEKYGSLIRFIRGEGPFDPLASTVPDEYFFIALSMTVTGAAALWKWDSIFLDRHDFLNLVPLPLKLRSIFLANLCAIFILVGLFTAVVNAASLILVPVAVVGSQGSLDLFIRYAAGHAVAVLVASAFASFAVFALVGAAMATLPTAAFAKVSAIVRFMVAVWLLVVLGSSFTVPDWLREMPVAEAHRLALLPPVSFLGVLRTVWGRAGAFEATMNRAGLGATGGALAIAMLAYALSFRRCFLRIPETADSGPLPRARLGGLRLPSLFNRVLRTPGQRAVWRFVSATLLRNDGHRQVVLGFLALGLVAAANALTSLPNARALTEGSTPPFAFLAMPFTLAYCLVAGIRFSFEMPSDLRANWIFQMWLDRERHEAREVARRVILVFSLSWIAPACFAATLAFWGWKIALLHTATVVLCTAALVELLLLRFRKIPFTCPYPRFQSHSGLTVVAYLFGFLLFTDYLVEIEQWALAESWRIVCFAPILGAVAGGIYAYRKQMLEMDKELVFDEARASGF